MKLTLEFIPRRQHPWAWYGLLTVALTCAALLGWHWQRARQESLALQGQMAQAKAQLDARQREAQRSAALAPVVQARLKAEQQVAAALRYPWNNVLATLEQAETTNLTVQTFSHEQGGRSSLTVEAGDTDALMRFVASLNDGDESERWYVSSYQVQQGSQTAVRATVQSR